MIHSEIENVEQKIAENFRFRERRCGFSVDKLLFIDQCFNCCGSN